MRRDQRLGVSIVVVAALLAACSRPEGRTAPADRVSAAVRKVHEEAANAADLSDPEAFADARRGFIAAPTGQVRNADGAVIWDFGEFDFVKGPAPATVNPSLWRQARLNNQVGLFKVTDGIHQLRGFDLANITLIDGATGWIVVDTLTSRETAAAAMAFARQHLGRQEGVGGDLHPQPHRPLRRRAGRDLGAGGRAAQGAGGRAGRVHGRGHERERVDGRGDGAALDVHVRQPSGALGAAAWSTRAWARRWRYGTVGILAPNRIVDRTPQEMTIDGVRFVFQNVPGSEAPAELTFYLPELKAYCGAEMLSHTMHNLYTLRGAKVRDALKWAGYIDAGAGQRRRRRGLFRLASLAGLGQGAHRAVHDRAARRLPLHARPDGANDERGPVDAARSPSRSSCRSRWTAS